MDQFIMFVHSIGTYITSLTGVDVKSVLIGILIVQAFEIPLIGRWFRRG